MTRWLAGALTLVCALAVFQFAALRRMRLEIARLQADARGRAIVAGTDEIGRAGAWLHAYYQSDEGFARPQGLCPDGQPDVPAIHRWIDGAYVNARGSGATETAAREAVMGGIHLTDAWRRQHPATR